MAQFQALHQGRVLAPARKLVAVIDRIGFRHHGGGRHGQQGGRHSRRYHHCLGGVHIGPQGAHVPIEDAFIAHLIIQGLAQNAAVTTVAFVAQTHLVGGGVGGVRQAVRRAVVALQRWVPEIEKKQHNV
jgi:hypothetical protein